MTESAPTIEVVCEEFARRKKKRQLSSCPQLWDLLDQVKDPEIPALSLWDLGVLQDIVADKQGIKVVITPTYSGCPAMVQMEQDIRQLLTSAGYQSLQIETRLSPPWNTEMISDRGRRQLFDYGIAPPLSRSSREGRVICPQCGSKNTQQLSQFGSTACKALYKCDECLEPFDYFKCL